MEKLALLAWIQAKPGMEEEVLTLLKDALPSAEAEPDTVRWYALKIGPSTFGIFDTFQSEEGRQAHLDGKIVEALIEQAPNLLAREPLIEKVDLLAVK